MSGQTYRIEIRFDVFGTEEQARAAANKAVDAVYANVEGSSDIAVTAIFDEDFEELD